MQPVSTKTITAMLALSAAFVIGIAGIWSHSSWTVIAGVAGVPPVVMMWLWDDPPQTMSQTIRTVLR